MRSTVAVALVAAGLAAVSADDALAELFYLDEDESAACMACQAEGVGYCVSRGECAYPVSGEKRVCDSPHDHIAASAAEAEWFCEQYGDELLHSDCGAALESDDATGLGQCTGGEVTEDHTFWIVMWILFSITWLGCCVASWTFGVIALCNAPKLGTGQPLCCACKPSCLFSANMGLAGGNFFMLLVYLIVVLGMWHHPDVGGIVSYTVLTGVTAIAALQLHKKKALWNQVAPVMGAPVMGNVVMGAPVMGACARSSPAACAPRAPPPPLPKLRSVMRRAAAFCAQVRP